VLLLIAAISENLMAAFFFDLLDRQWGSLHGFWSHASPSCTFVPLVVNGFAN
jgi:hypothetical protein